MKGVAYWFFTLAVVYVTLGMIWGIQMSITGDHSLSPAHAHLNLVGWVTTGFFGIYYHLVPQAAERQLARIHLWVATVGVFLMIPGIVLALTRKFEPLAAAGSMVTLLSMLIFLYTVVSNRVRN